MEGRTDTAVCEFHEWPDQVMVTGNHVSVCVCMFWLDYVALLLINKVQYRLNIIHI